MKWRELLTNKDGSFSTTGTIQFFSWLVASGLLIYAVVNEYPLMQEWFELYLALCVFGSPATKGLVSVLSKVGKTKNG